MNTTRRILIGSFFVFTVAILLLPATVRNASAELKTLSDSEMSGVYAEGFSNFTITDLGLDGLGNPITETLAVFNIQAYTYTTIDSLKLGFYDNGTTNGWDEDWTDVVIGQDINRPADDLKADGVYFKANFTNIDDPTQRVLNSISFGANSVTGDISAEFNSFNGTINGIDYYRDNIGSATITSANSPFELTLSLDKGYWVTFGAGSSLTTPRLYDMP